MLQGIAVLALQNVLVTYILQIREGRMGLEVDFRGLGLL